MIYADSSFIVSLYFRDGNSAAANREVGLHKRQIALSWLARLEVKNAFRLAVFRNWLTTEQEQRVQALFDSDSRDGILVSIPFTADIIFSEAEKLSRAYTAISGNRSLDLLHLACARLAGLEVFASFDERQRALARTIGLSVVPN